MLIGAIGSMVLAMVVSSAIGNPLAEYRWKSRIVVIFGDEENEAVLRQSADLETESSEAEDREMIVFTVVGQTVSDGGHAARMPKASDLRDQFQVSIDRPFTVILVGKDGTEKLRRDTPVAASELFSLVDSMPMRQSEIGR